MPSRMVISGANDQREDRHRNPTAEKARTLPVAKPLALTTAHAEQRQASRNHQHVQGL